MKKIFSLVAMLMFVGSSVASAVGWFPDHLYDDPNYIAAYAHMGAGSYVDASSLAVEVYDPPRYILTVDVAQVRDMDRGNTEITSVGTCRFLYDWDGGRVYYDKNTGTNDWKYIPPEGSNAQRGFYGPIAEIAFYLAYGMKFYGDDYPDAFSDALYERLP